MISPFLPCDRPDCMTSARHEMKIAGMEITGWKRLCCWHADHAMLHAATLVREPEASKGWSSWRKQHRAECGMFRKVMPEEGA